MKRNIILLLCIAALTFSSCEKILDKQPSDKLSIVDLFKDVPGAKTALAGAYSDLLSEYHYMRNTMVYTDLLAGNIKYSKIINNRLEDVYNVIQTPIISPMNDTYAGLYDELNNVNNIISYTPGAAGSDLEKAKILAEAKCLRALIHFDLVRIFARPFNYTANASHVGIAVILKPQLFGDPAPVRVTVAETYQVIINDLLEAISRFDDTNKGVLNGELKQNFFTKLSAKALLAKVYLNANNWDNAYNTADEIIKSNQYSLLTNANYVASWTGRAPSSESIFELAIENTFNSTGLGGYFELTNTAYRQYAATADLTGLYSASDVRRPTTMFNPISINSVAYLFSKKYAAGGTGQTPIKVLRLSELYLIRAEAALEKATPNFVQANTDLNAIRRRGDASAVILNLTSKNLLIDAVLLERRKELAFEGNLLYDLARRKKDIVRADCTSQNCNITADDYRLVMPIPSNTIIANRSMVQNQGY
ncbi:RagB/SusD family nutrient uptake outer membrane protein [Pedobacter sp. N23S346]|uniref:RagB/SusD family nutrient uptake outer membrane protein n=1 Tax=Pedobacter sp. N23S346 TaxID=3402750 RepID=UPI003ACE4D59